MSEKDYGRVMDELLSLRDAVTHCADACGIPAHVHYERRLGELAHRYTEAQRMAALLDEHHADVLQNRQEKIDRLQGRVLVLRQALENVIGRDRVIDLLQRQEPTP